MREIAGINAAFRPTRNPAVHAIELDGELVLYDRSTNRLHILDRPAALLWQCFDGVSSLAEIAEDIARELAAAPTTVERDAVTLARMVGQIGLLSGVTPDAPENAARGPGEESAH